MGRLEGKVAIVTGAARGVGAATARLFVAEGASVVLGDVLDDPGKQVAVELGERARYVHLDVSRESDWEAAIVAAEELGPLNVLVNNAAIQEFRSLAGTRVEDYRRMAEVNQIGPFLGMRSAIEPMKRAGGGSIVNLSSVDGMSAKNGNFAYVSSKWAVRGMTKAAALELGHHGIRVNSVHPGGLDTQMGNPTGSPEIGEFYKRMPIPRVGQPEDIAKLILFLASDDSAYSTGSEFLADGGWLAGEFIPGLPRS